MRHKARIFLPLHGIHKPCLQAEIVMEIINIVYAEKGSLGLLQAYLVILVAPIIGFLGVIDLCALASAPDLNVFTFLGICFQGKEYE